MKESAQIALSYVRSHAAELGVDPAALDRPIHVHVPAGAVPKDGPSAGVTMVTALVSLATGRPVRSEVGMTGEVTLNGRVLPIGGVKQKLLAAQRAGLTEVFLPQRNEPDLDDVPADVREAVTVHLVGDVSTCVRTEPSPQQDAGRRCLTTWPSRRPIQGTPGRPSGRSVRRMNDPARTIAVTWWGHAFATVELGGVSVATDPLLGGPAPPPAPVRRDPRPRTPCAPTSC